MHSSILAPSIFPQYDRILNMRAPLITSAPSVITVFLSLLNTNHAGFRKVYLLFLMIFFTCLSTRIAYSQINFDATDGTLEERVLLTWDEVEEAGTILTIERDGETLAVVARTVTSFEDTSGALRKVYDYCLLSQKSILEPGVSLGCNEGSRAIFKPNRFSATNGDLEDRVDLSWSDRSQVEDGYVLFRDGGTALQFDGIDDEVNLDHDPAIDPGTSDFTIEFWIKKNKDGREAILSKRAECNGDFNFFSFRATRFIDFELHDSADRARVESTTDIADGDWHHVAGVRTGGEIRLYVDGMLEATAINATPRNLSNSEIIRMGKDVCVGKDDTKQFEGSLDEVRVWNLARDEASIQQDRHERLKGNEEGLAAYFPLDTGSGASAFDVVAGREGRLINMDDDAWVNNAPVENMGLSLPRNATAYQDFEATPGVTYTYGLAIYIDSDNDGSFTEGVDFISTAVSTRGTRAVVNPPSDIVASDGEYADRVVITWIDQSISEDAWQVLRIDPATSDTLNLAPISVADGSTTGEHITFEDTPDLPGHVYRYCVASVAGNVRSNLVCDNGAFGGLQISEVISATIDTFDDRIEVTWEDINEAEDHFEISRRLSTESEDMLQVLAILDEGTTFYQDFTAVQNSASQPVDYTYCVRAVSMTDPENPTLSSYVCTEGRRAPVLPPQDLATSTEVLEDRIELTWTNLSTTSMLVVLYRDGNLLETLPPESPRYADYAIPSDQETEYCITNVTLVTGSAAEQEEIINQIAALQQGGVNTFASVASKKGDGETRTLGVDGSSPVTLIGTLAAAGVSQNIILGLEESDKEAACITGQRSINAPSSVVASIDQFEDHVSLNWGNESKVQKGFNIHRSDGRTDEVIAQVTPNRDSYRDYTGASGVTYEYRIAAYDDFGASKQIAAEGKRSLLEPSDLIASNGADEAVVSLAWTDNSEHELGYHIYRRKAGAPAFSHISGVPANITRFDDPHALTSGVVGTIYEYQVIAFDEHGESLPVTATGFTAIQPPGSVNASDTYEDKVVISWTDQSEMESEYSISRNGTLLASVGPNELSFEDNVNLTGGAINEYCVTSIKRLPGQLIADESVEVCDNGQIPAPLNIARGAAANVSNKIQVDQTSSFKDAFGRSVSSSGNYALLQSQNLAYFLRRSPSDPGIWEELKSESAKCCGDISGDYAIVNVSKKHTVSVFERNKGGLDNWGKVTDLESGDHPLTPESDFGEAISISGDHAIIGAAGTRSNSGAAYVYKRDANTNSWTLKKKLEEAFNNGSRFGGSVSISGDHAIVSRDGGGVGRKAYIYRRDEGGEDNWGKVDSLTIDNEGNGFARSVAIFENFAAVYDGDYKIFERNTGGANQWGLLTTIKPSDAEFFSKVPGFRKTISFSRNYLVIGSSSDGDKGGKAGAAYVFQKHGLEWVEIDKLLPDDGFGAEGDGTEDVDGLNFGEAVSISDDDIFIGAPNNLEGNGSVYTIPVLAQPVNVVASDGTLDDRIQVQWEDESPHEERYKVYRLESDGSSTEINQGLTGANEDLYDDFTADPGGAYTYCVAAHSATLENSISALGESSLSCASGWRPPNGTIAGRVAAQSGGGIADASVCLAPSPNKSLHLDGFGGYVDASVEGIANKDPHTVEAWINISEIKQDSTWILRMGPEGKGALRWYVSASGIARIGTWGGRYANIKIDTGEWAHVSSVWDGAEYTVRVNGFFPPSFTTPSTPVDLNLGTGKIPMTIGKSHSPGGIHFAGLVDEVRVWNTARTIRELDDNMFKQLQGDEQGLIAYWSFDEGARRVTADLTRSGNNGLFMGGANWSQEAAPLDVCSTTDLEGNYTRRGIRYGTETTFDVRPSKGTNTFEPGAKNITLSAENPVENEVDFIDNSLFTVSGSISFDNARSCAVENVPLHVDGQSRAISGADGTYQVALPPSDNPYEFSPVLEGRTFSPLHPDIHPIEVTGDVQNVRFVDNTKRSLKLFVGAGCNRAIGQATVRVRTEDGCFSQSYSVAGSSTIELPPQRYLVEVTDVTLNGDSELDLADVLEFYESVGTQEINLADEDTTVQFIYRAPLSIRLTGLPEKETQACSAEIGVPRLTQGALSFLNIFVSEKYGPAIEDECRVEEGSITIFDGIADAADAPVEIEIDQGMAHYLMQVGQPNIAAGAVVEGINRSFQKSITIDAEVDGRAGSLTEWALVEGERTRPGTFLTAASDPIPMSVLRDPPGDQSYSYIEAGASYCYNVDQFSLRKELGVAGNVGLNIGVEGTVGIAVVNLDVAAGLRVGVKGGFLESFSESGATRLCYSVDEKLATSAGPDFVGEDADVFVGLGLNFLLAESDVLTVNEAVCEVEVTEQAAAAIDNFNTAYAYTQSHIRDVIIPDLEKLQVQDTESGRDYPAEINNWNNHLLYNEISKLPEEVELYENRSFAAGADYEGRFSDSRTYSRDWETTVSFDVGGEAEASASLGGVGLDGGVSIDFGLSQSGSLRDICYAARDEILDAIPNTIDVEYPWRDCSEQTTTTEEKSGGGGFLGFLSPVTSIISSVTSFSCSEPRDKKDNFQVSEYAKDALDRIADFCAGFSIAPEDEEGSEETTVSNAVGYVLSDNDAGDHFSVDVSFENVEEVSGYTPDGSPSVIVPKTFGTPVFKTVAGVSSAPWESNTQKRDLPELDIEPSILRDVPMDQPAVFNLLLKNSSESSEARTYKLQTVHSENEGGAILRAQGSPIHEGIEFHVPPGQQQNITLEVERGPARFAYEGLQVTAYPPNDPDLAAFQSFDVFFDAPCSDISVLRPTEFWSYNSGNVPAPITIKAGGFTLASQDLTVERLGLQFRRQGQNSFTTIQESVYTRNPDGTYSNGSAMIDQSSTSISADWDVSGRGDGVYEIRAFTECGPGPSDRVSSAIVSGTIDRSAPGLIASNSDELSVLGFGQDLTVAFNEPVSCESVSHENVLMSMENGQPIDITAKCDAASLTLYPESGSWDDFEGQRVAVEIVGFDPGVGSAIAPITDVHGNSVQMVHAKDSDAHARRDFLLNRSGFSWEPAVLSLGRDETLIASLVNGRDEENHYSLDQLPDWIKPSVTSGTLPPNSKREVTFNVDLEARLASDTLQANAGEWSAPLALECNAPDWTVSPMAFKYAMTFDVQLFMGEDMQPSDDNNDLVGAFVGEELRGFGAVLDPSTGHAHVGLYSNEAAGEQVTFQVWDQSECKFYPATDRSITFTANNALGAGPEGLETLRATFQQLQEIDVAAGWTWLSFNRMPADSDINALLQQMKSNDEDIFTGQDIRLSFQKDLDAWSGDLLELSPLQSYKMKLAEAQRLSVFGKPVDLSKPLTVEAGWNWIGYLPQVALPVNEALANFPAKEGDMVQGQFAFATYVPDLGWVGSLDLLEPGSGYRLYSTSKASFRYPTPDRRVANVAEPDTTQTAATSDLTAESAVLPAFKPETFENNMTLVAAIAREDKAIENVNTQVWVTAGNDEDVRGVGRLQYIEAINEYRVFLTIFGDEVKEEDLILHAVELDINREHVLANAISYEANSHVGSLAEPIRFNMVAGAGELPEDFALHQNFPNPFNPVTTIHYELPRDEHVEILIFDILGREVGRLVDTAQKAGRYDMTFNASHLASGVYLYTIKAGRYKEVKKMVLLK